MQHIYNVLSTILFQFSSISCDKTFAALSWIYCSSLMVALGCPSCSWYQYISIGRIIAVKTDSATWGPICSRKRERSSTFESAFMCTYVPQSDVVDSRVCLRIHRGIVRFWFFYCFMIHCNANVFLFGKSFIRNKSQKVCIQKIIITLNVSLFALLYTHTGWNI